MSALTDAQDALNTEILNLQSCITDACANKTLAENAKIAAVADAVIASDSADAAAVSAASAVASANLADANIIIWKGAWVAGTYNDKDAVSNNGSSFIANKTTTAEPSVVSVDWDIYALKGDDGDAATATTVVDNVTSSSTTDALSANQGFVLKGLIDAINVGGSLDLGVTSTTAYRGDHGLVAYDHSSVTTGNPHGVNKTDVGLSDVDNTSDLDKPISTVTQNALDGKVDDGQVMTNVPAGALFTDTTYAIGDGGLTEKNFTTAQADAIVANTAKVGLTAGQIADIATNTAKVGITTSQANAIITNTAKVGITTAQADAIVANTAKVGITAAQASDILGNNSKVSYTDAAKVALITITSSVDLDQLNIDVASLANGMVYKGNWYAGAGTFPSGANTGWLYHVSGAGTVDNEEFAIGDNIVATTDGASTTSYNDWSKHDQTDAVQTVAGRVGNVVVTTDDLADFDTGVSANSDVVANTAKVGLTAGQITTLDNTSGVNTGDYTHPSGDGSLHVPATDTINDGKVLTAGATAGSLTWETPITYAVGDGGLTEKNFTTELNDKLVDLDGLVGGASPLDFYNLAKG